MNNSSSIQFPLLAGLGYALGGVFATRFFLASANINFFFPFSWLENVLAGAIMGLCGGLFLGSTLATRKNHALFSLWSTLSGSLAAGFMLLLINKFGFYSSWVIYAPLVSGAFLVASGFMWFWSRSWRQALHFGLYGILAGFLGLLSAFAIIFVFALLQGIKGIYSIMAGYGFFAGGLLGFFLKNFIANQKARAS